MNSSKIYGWTWVPWNEAVPALVVSPILLLVWKSRQIIWIKHDEPPTKRMEVKMNRASFLCENRSGHYNLNLKTWRHVTGHNEQHTPLKIGCELGCYIKVSSSSDTRVSHSSFRSPLHLDVSFRYESGVFCRASTGP
jgi:hypothetical protein